MSSLSTALVALLALVGGIMVGSLIRSRLPDGHLHDDSRDVLKLASGMIATLVALVIGLLVSSSKSSFDQASAGATQIGAKVILLDHVLKRYGTETNPIRHQLSQGIAESIDRLWPKSWQVEPGLAAVERATTMEDVLELIAQLEPRDETRRVLRTHALALISDLNQARWLIIEQAQATLPPLFLAVLIFWLTVLFTSLGLLAPWNATTLSSLFVCALSMAIAIYLILEMNHPFTGLIRISPAPLHKAIAVIRA